MAVLLTGAEPIPSKYDPVFANNDWSAIIEACQANEVPDTWNVADQKAMTIDGTDYPIDIIGKNHDDYADGTGKSPLTLQMHHVYNTYNRMNSSQSNSGGWTSCDMRTTHLPALLALMPAEVQGGIREVNKLTSAGNGSSTINTTADKLFLLSPIEVFNAVGYSATGEGTQYSYYLDANNIVKNSSDDLMDWWLRSPNVNNKTGFCKVDAPNTNTFQYANITSYLAPAFCF